jgi:hypothetical protein
MQKSGLLKGATLIGLVKEVAPCSTAKTDEELGVAEFQSKYFPFPLYLDQTKGFYSALGDRKITGLQGSWNPFEVWKGLKSIGTRIKEKGLEGNFRGEGLVLGGIVVIDTAKSVVKFTYCEETGKEIPRDEIAAAVRGI